VLRLPSDGVVTLSLFRPSDAAVMRDGDRDAEHRRWFELPEHFVPSVQHSRDVIALWERKRAAGERFPFAVRDAGTGELLGGCELRPVGKGAASLAYWTYPAHRSRGVASRAVALACQVASEQLRFRRLEVLADPDNGSSRRVALRNGFREAGLRDRRVLHIKELSSVGGDRVSTKAR
jgi:RimJ/RimL family protein N-acetyltransferase